MDDGCGACLPGSEGACRKSADRRGTPLFADCRGVRGGCRWTNGTAYDGESPCWVSRCCCNARRRRASFTEGAIAFVTASGCVRKGRGTVYAAGVMPGAPRRAVKPPGKKGGDCLRYNNPACDIRSRLSLLRESAPPVAIQQLEGEAAALPALLQHAGRRKRLRPRR